MILLDREVIGYSLQVGGGNRQPYGRHVPAETTSFTSKSELAYEAVRRRILGGVLEPGAVIGQTRLAADLGISTTPLREALGRLAAEGLVALGVHKDARVVELSSEEAQNLFEMRSALDPLACELAALRHRDEDLESIDDALGELQPLTGESSAEALWAHRRFHRAIYLAAGNPVLVGVLDSIWDKSDLYRQRALQAHSPSEADRARVEEQHQRLRDAIVAADPVNARSLSHAHITHSLGRRAIGLLEA